MVDRQKGPPCDECGKEVIPNVDARYAIADKFDEDGNYVSSRHWRCHTPIEKLLDDAKDLMRKAEGTLRDLKW